MTTPILGQPTVTAERAAAWAARNGATEKFRELAGIYWQQAAAHGGVNPAVAYAQAAHETGMGRFGGVLDASYRNPCGMKKGRGGGDDDPGAHVRFLTWRRGVAAHLDHLALYAGADGYPRRRTPDPRHFRSLHGTARTVEALGGRWAPSPTYGATVAKLHRSLTATGAAPAKAPPFVPRAGWGAAAPRGRYLLNPAAVRGIFVHYTGMDTDEQADHRNCPARVRGVQAFHQGPQRGWSDIAYSFLVCRHGVVYEGRGWGVQGAHTMGHNSTAHAVCFLGNDTSGRDDVTNPGRNALGWVIREALRRYPHGRQVQPHSAVYSTSCPGDQLRAWIRQEGWK